MDNKVLSLRACLAFAALLPMTTTSNAEEAADAAARNTKDMQFATIPGMPTCATASVQSGDPGKGASIILAKLAAGCVIPWHWHTSSETLLMVSGTGRAEMKGSAAVMLHAGGYGRMPSKHVHQFGCAKACMLFVVSDAAFDMHYVDADGKDIAPDEALKKVHQTPAKAPR